MKQHDVPAHESGHVLAALQNGIPVHSVSIRPRKGAAGIAHFDPPRGRQDELDLAVAVVAGDLAEQKAVGQPQRFNWLSDTPDAATARSLIDAYVGHEGGDALDIRRLVELRARSTIAAYWATVSAIAVELERKRSLTGEEVSRIRLADAARRGARALAAKPPPKPPARKPRRPKRAIPPGAEVRPFTFTVVEKGAKDA